MKRAIIFLLTAIIILITSCTPEPYDGNIIQIDNCTNGNASVCLRKAADPPVEDFKPLTDGQKYVECHDGQKTSYVLVFRVMDGDAVIDVTSVDIDMTDSYYFEAWFFYSAEHGIECVSRYK